MRIEGITHVINLIAHRVKGAPKPEEMGIMKIEVKKEGKTESKSIYEYEDLKYLKLSMRDLVDSDITFFIYSAIEFIEEAFEKS